MQHLAAIIADTFGRMQVVCYQLFHFLNRNTSVCSTTAEGNYQAAWQHSHSTIGRNTSNGWLVFFDRISKRDSSYKQIPPVNFYSPRSAEEKSELLNLNSPSFDADTQGSLPPAVERESTEHMLADEFIGDFDEFTELFDRETDLPMIIQAIR